MKHSTSYKEVTSAWNFASNEYKNLRDLICDNKANKQRLHQFLAHFVAPTASSDFEVLDDAKLDAWIEKPVPEERKWPAMPEEELSIPFRMLDLFMGNLVETRKYGPFNKYCILSHSWKGMEIDYEYFARASVRIPSQFEIW